MQGEVKDQVKDNVREQPLVVAMHALTEFKRLDDAKREHAADALEKSQEFLDGLTRRMAQLNESKARQDQACAQQMERVRHENEAAKRQLDLQQKRAQSLESCFGLVIVIVLLGFVFYRYSL